MKVCTICKTTKELSDFYKSNQTKDGFEGQCKKCRKRNKVQKERSKPDYRDESDTDNMQALRRLIEGNCKPLQIRVIADSLLIFDKIGGISFLATPISESYSWRCNTQNTSAEVIHDYERMTTKQIINILNKLFPKQ